MEYGCIGTGTIGKLLIEKYVQAGKSVSAFDADAGKLNSLRKALRIRAAKDNREVVENSDTIYLCIKPQELKNVISELKACPLKNKLIVTTVAAVKSDFYRKELKGLKIIRIIPSITNLVKAGVVLYSTNESTSKEDEATLVKDLSLIGCPHRVEEEKMEIFTHLTSCAPALISQFMKFFLNSLEKHGLEGEGKEKLAYETLNGTAKLLNETGFGLIERVCTAKGITFEGIKVLSEIEPTVDKMVEKMAEKQSAISKTVMQNESD